MIHAQVQQFLRSAQGTGAHGETPLIQNPHGCPEALADHIHTADDIVPGHPAVSKYEFRGLGAFNPHLCHPRARLKTRGCPFRQ